MPQSKSLLQYNDCREVLDRAVSEGAIEVPCGSYAQAVVFRRRCNHFRQLDRDENLVIYPTEHRMHGRSIYDTLELCLPPKGDPLDNVLTIRPRIALNYTIQPAGTARAQLEAQKKDPAND